jgi:hypothetical protein
MATKIKASGNQRSAQAVKPMAVRTIRPSCCTGLGEDAAVLVVVISVLPALFQPRHPRLPLPGWLMLIRIKMALLIQINGRAVARPCRTAIARRVDLLLLTEVRSERLS